MGSTSGGWDLRVDSLVALRAGETVGSSTVDHATSTGLSTPLHTGSSTPTPLPLFLYWLNTNTKYHRTGRDAQLRYEYTRLRWVVFIYIQSVARWW